MDTTEPLDAVMTLLVEALNRRGHERYSWSYGDVRTAVPIRWCWQLSRAGRKRISRAMLGHDECMSRLAVYSRAYCHSHTHVELADPAALHRLTFAVLRELRAHMSITRRLTSSRFRAKWEECVREARYVS